MADPLEWKEGEGYDIHVLRGGPASKVLDNSLLLDTSTNALSPSFTAHFKGAPNNHGVDVNASTGEVTASAHPGSPQPKFPNFNFLMTARQIVGGVGTYETKIRIHVHDTVEKIWLTPSTLTIHLGSDENRFTVLALFDDGTVGDITDWTQLTYQSADPTAVSVLGPTSATETSAATTAGVVAAADAGLESVITVSLNLAAPSTNLSATAKVITAPKWEEVGKTAKVQFVAGPLKPQEDDMDPTHPGSVAAVIKGKVNILFVAEGFPAGKESVFRNSIVKKIVETELLLSENLQPFKLLADSINYWSVFVESRDEGVSVLDDHELLGSALERPAFEVPLARPPQSTSSVWTPIEMMHEGGLPMPSEPSASEPQAWATSRRKIYDIPAQAPVNPKIELADVGEWNDLKSRTLLNERDTVFGMAHYDRPRASGQGRAEGRLLPDMRRTGAKSIETFLQNLKFGADAVTSIPYDIGEAWVEDTSSAGDFRKDFGLVCFVCQSDTRGGSWKVAVTQLFGRNIAFSTVGLGAGDRVMVRAAANGSDVVPPTGTKIPLAILASQVAYGIGSAFWLRDENGDGERTVPGPTTIVFGDNLQDAGLIVNTTSGVSSIDARKIAWLWPRVINSGVVKVDVDIISGKVLSPEKCDANGIPNLTGGFVLVQFLKSPLKPFANGDLVRLRASVMRSGSHAFWQKPSRDEFAAFPFFVEKVLNDKVVLGYQTPSLPQLGYLNPAGPQLDFTLFDKVVTCFLIGPRILAGAESKLVADPIWKHIDSSDSPLNAPPNSQGQTCTPAPHARADVTASNLPLGLKLPKKLPSKADIVGIYDGGAHFDCGVFRPAGRCRMRRGLDATTPFCHVCLYIIVDKVDPTMHGLLDDLYQLQYPS